jgi:hypothetical protein
MDVEYTEPLLNPLPNFITIEMTFQKMGKLTAQPDQFPMNPCQSFDDFQKALINNVQDVIGFNEEQEKVIFSWKWEKRIMQQTVARKTPLPYSQLSRERHWEAVRHVLREANGVKKGCHNMLLRILANIMSKSEHSLSEGIETNSAGIREVMISRKLPNGSLQPLSSIVV